MRTEAHGSSWIALPRIAMIVSWFGVVGLARADLIYFQEGGAIQAPVSMRGESVVIELAGEEYVFTSEDVAKRLPGFEPSDEWEARRARTNGAGVDARFKAAWWAMENGLTDEAVAEIRAIHREFPSHAPTARMAAALGRLEPNCEDPEIPGLRGTLRVAFETARGPHVLLLHQTGDVEAAARVALLERVVTTYYLTFAGSGIDLKVPEKRIVFAWFADQSDYLAFVGAQAGAAFSTTRGYYHPTWNAVVSFEARSAETDRREQAVLADRREELNRFRTSLDRLPPGARVRVSLSNEPTRTLGKSAAMALHDRLSREVQRRELLLIDRRIAMDDGIAAHETFHLLAAVSGLSPRHDAFPLWLQEGLAMQFEVVRGGRWAGVGRAHDIRLTDWRNLDPPPPLAPLIRDKGFGRGYQRDPYVQAWALVYFLRARRPAEFVTYLDLLRNPSPPPTDEPSHPFTRAFGEDLDSLERDWHTYLHAAATPLEANAPPKPVSALRPSNRP